MTPFFVYLIKSSISLALLYSLFRFVMRNDKAHTLNRFLLLGILLFSAVIPFLNIQFFTKEVAVQPVENLHEFISTTVFAPETAVAKNLPVEQAADFSISTYQLAYAGMILILLIRLLISVIRVIQIIKHAQKQRIRNIVLAVVKDFIQPFTFLDKIVLSEKDFNENKNIVVAHEHAHIKQLHAIDLVVCELFLLLHFFNPFMWLLRRDLKLVHEYQADQAVLQKGIDSKKYQLLVLEKAVGETRFAMANHFRQKPILKRIKMMQTKNRNQWAFIKLILFVPVLIVLLQAFARPELINTADDFIPAKYTENESEKWLSKWNSKNMGKGFYEPILESPDSPQKPNNVLVILMNRNDDFLIEDQRKNKEEIKQIVKNYLLGSNPDGKNGPDYGEKEIPFIGRIKVSKGAIVYKHDLASSKEMIDYTLRSIGEACLEVRKEKAQILFGKDYFDLDEEKRKGVDQAVPVWFSYDRPKSPTPNVWLPFDEKPSKPDPIKITFKGNGNVIVENHKFDSLEEFEENLKYWNNELDEFNKDRRSNGFYRAHVTYEDISRSEQKNISYILYKNNVHIEQIRSNVGFTTVSIMIKAENDAADMKEIRQKAEKDFKKYNGEFDVRIQYADGVTEEQKEAVKDIYQELGIKNIEVNEYKRSSPPLFLMHLYPNEVKNVYLEPISMDDVSEYTKSWLEKVRSKYSAAIYAHQNVSEERIQQLREKIEAGGVLAQINVKKLD